MGFLATKFERIRCSQELVSIFDNSLYYINDVQIILTSLYLFKSHCIIHLHPPMVSPIISNADSGMYIQLCGACAMPISASRIGRARAAKSLITIP